MKAAVKRKEVLAARDGEARGGVWKSTKRKVKRFIYQNKKIQEHFGRKMNSRCELKQEIVLDGGELDEWRKGGEFQQNKGCKWEVGTARG